MNRVSKCLLNLMWLYRVVLVVNIDRGRYSWISVVSGSGHWMHFLSKQCNSIHSLVHKVWYAECVKCFVWGHMVFRFVKVWKWLQQFYCHCHLYKDVMMSEVVMLTEFIFYHCSLFLTFTIWLIQLFWFSKVLLNLL